MSTLDESINIPAAQWNIVNNNQIQVSTLNEELISQEAISAIIQGSIISPLLVDIEFVVMKTCLYTYYCLQK